jgi:hypothetical protein
MITCQSIAASVECQDESGFWTALPEYRVTSPDDKTMTCFIESKAGKHFRVKYHEVYKLPNSSYDACISTWVDGKEMECYTYERARVFGQYNHTTVEGVRTSSTERLPFTFAKVLNFNPLSQGATKTDAHPTFFCHPSALRTTALSSLLRMMTIWPQGTSRWSRTLVPSALDSIVPFWELRAIYRVTSTKRRVHNLVALTSVRVY